MVYRVYVEKKTELAHEANGLFHELSTLVGIKALTGVRVINRYDVENIEGELFEKAKSEPKNIRTVLSVNSAEETKIIFDAQTGKLLETRRMSYQ